MPRPCRAEVDAALARAKVPRDAVTMLVADADGQRPPRLAWRTQVPVNPASVMKLVTTYAALDLLGPAYTWTTPVYVDGPVRDGVLDGNLYIKGQGDPKLVLERLWLLLRRVQGAGHPDASAATSCWTAAPSTPASPTPAPSTARPLRPYNAAPDALLINFKSVVMTFMPDAATARWRRCSFEPPLAGVAVQATVPLARRATAATGAPR